MKSIIKFLENILMQMALTNDKESHRVYKMFYHRFFALTKPMTAIKSIIKYFGFRYQCLFCGGHFRKLLPTGLDNRIASTLITAGYRYALCPRCSSTDRERLVYYYIKNKTDIFESKKILKLLHIAPEKNLQRILKSYPSIDYISGDLDSPLVDIKIDVTNMNFKDNYFDIIICNHVLEHIPNDEKAMSELFRVLKRGGWAILQVPISKLIEETSEDFSITSPEERERYFGQSDHVRIYGKDYKERLESIGFKVDLYDIKKDLKVIKCKKYGLNEEEILYIGRKS